MNSGGAGRPRNFGLRCSRGKYIFLMDADDAIIDTALEELHNFAEDSDADIVHCEKWYIAFNENFTTDKDFLKLSSVTDVNHLFTCGFMEDPTVMSEDLAERTKIFCKGSFWWAPWSHLIKRSLLVENEIEFSNLKIADDLLFSTFLMIAAKKILYIPSAVYIWRVLRDSNSRAILDAKKTIHKRAGDIFRGINLLEKFMDKFEFFSQSPNCKHDIYEFFTLNQMGYIVPVYAQNPPFILNKLAKKELEEIGTTTELTAFLFSRMSILQMNLMKQHEIIRYLNAKVSELQRPAANQNNFFR